MEKVRKIMEQNKFRAYVMLNQKWEKERQFCKHNMSHFIDVARIAYITNLERQLGYEKEIIYTAALLHDIGRWAQYQFGIPHNESSAALSIRILRDAGFSPNDIEIIVSAIQTHRSYEKEDNSLNALLYHADKKSRKCFSCKEKKNCNWAEGKKNKNLTV